MSEIDFKSIVIFTDGACTGNPGPGGWAAVIAYPEARVQELGGGNPATTNNRMEMVGVLRALAEVRDRPEKVVVYTDSVYVIRGITEWIWGWRSRGWKTAEGKDVLNRDIWQALSEEVTLRKPRGLEWKFVRGHRGVPGNERCDVIAVAYAKNQAVKLYDGPLLQYSHAIYDLPPDEGLPERRPKEVKPKAFSYLSLLGGTVYRHSDWPACERRVKGQSGAKFKKAMSAADEAEILSAWGLDPKTPVKE